jgi:hypothetical protein
MAYAQLTKKLKELFDEKYPLRTYQGHHPFEGQALEIIALYDGFIPERVGLCVPDDKGYGGVFQVVSDYGGPASYKLAVGRDAIKNHFSNLEIKVDNGRASEIFHSEHLQTHLITDPRTDMTYVFFQPAPNFVEELRREQA